MDAAKTVTANFSSFITATEAQSITPTGATLKVSTNARAQCRYSTISNAAFDAMTIIPASSDKKSHSKQITGLAQGTGHTYYIKCKKLNVDSYATGTIRFTTLTQQYQLTITKAGAGLGTVNSTPTGIASCGIPQGTCAYNYPENTQVKLVAVTSDANSIFTGWSGEGVSCPGVGDCTVTTRSAKAVTASFVQSYTVTAIFNSPYGNVYSCDRGIISGTYTGGGTNYIDCGQDAAGTGHRSCSIRVPAGTTVQLTASQINAGCKFIKWKCTAAGVGSFCQQTTSPISVYIDKDTNVNAYFANPQTPADVLASVN